MKCKYTKNIYLRQETTFASANVIAQCASVVSPSVWTEHVGAGHVGAGSEPARTECDGVEPARTECDRVEFTPTNTIMQNTNEKKPSQRAEHVGAGHVGAGSEPARTNPDHPTNHDRHGNRIHPEPPRTECDHMEPDCIPTVMQNSNEKMPSQRVEHVWPGHVGAGSEPPRTECDRVEPARTECDRVEPARTRCGGVEPACIPTVMQRKNLQRVYAKRQF